MNYPNYVCVAIGQDGVCNIANVSRDEMQIPSGTVVTWVTGTSEPVPEARLRALRDALGGVAQATARDIEGASSVVLDEVSGFTSGFARAVSAHQSVAGAVGDTQWRSFPGTAALVKLDPDDRRVALARASEAVGALFVKESPGKRGFVARARDAIVRKGAQARVRRQMNRVFALADEAIGTLSSGLDPSERSAAMHRLGGDVATALSRDPNSVSDQAVPGSPSRGRSPAREPSAMQRTQPAPVHASAPSVVASAGSSTDPSDAFCSRVLHCV